MKNFFILTYLLLLFIDLLAQNTDTLIKQAEYYYTIYQRDTSNKTNLYSAISILKKAYFITAQNVDIKNNIKIINKLIAFQAATNNFTQIYNDLSQIKKNTTDKKQLINLFLKVSNLAFNQHYYKIAIKFADQAFILAAEIYNPILIEKIATQLSIYYKKINDYDKSLMYYKIANEYKLKQLQQILIKQNNIITSQQKKIQQKDFYLLEKKYKVIKTLDSLKLLEEKQKKKNALLLALNANQKITKYFLNYKRKQLKERQNIIILLISGFFLLLMWFLLYLKLYTDRKKALNELKNLNRQLQEKNLELQQKNTTIEQQKEKLQHINKELQASITYASKLQFSILPSAKSLKKLFPNSFVLFKPRDIVSGDFMYLAKKDNYRFIAEIDCTGHGVPGAILSILAYTMLNQIIINQDITEPKDILSALNKEIEKHIKNNDEKSLNDGLEITLLRTDDKNITIASANQYSMVYIDEKIYALEGSIFSIGQCITNIKPKFEQYQFTLGKKNIIYLFSDGFFSQLNPKGQKYLLKDFVNLLDKIKDLPLDIQKNKLEQEFLQWKNGKKQMDDVLIIGIKL